MSSSATTDLDEVFSRLFKIFDSEDFRSGKSAGNIPPLYIQPYLISKQAVVDKHIKALSKKLTSHGRNVLGIDLLDLVYEITSESGDLEWLIEKESGLSPEKTLSLMSRWLDPVDTLLPAITRKLDSTKWDLAIFTGCGAVYPFIRMHTVFEALPTKLERSPVVFFYPGEYSSSTSHGSALHLFGKLSHSGHHRGINLDHYYI